MSKYTKEGWGIICRYIPKMKKKKVVWGEYSLKQILEIGDASAKDQAIPYKPEKTGGAVVIEKVMKYDEWYDAPRRSRPEGDSY